MNKTDAAVVLFYTGKIVLWMAGLMLIPAITGAVFDEWESFFDFLLGSSFSFCIGFLFLLLGNSSGRGLTWTQGFTVAAFSWLVLMFLSAIPYYLSGHWGSFLDCTFDVMSGFTTTGLVLVQDLDHISNAVNMWRHMLTYIGGQGMVVLALTVLSRNLPGAFKLYVGEAKDERLMPSVGQTARAIWFISLVWLAIGTAALWVAGVVMGMHPVRALLHGLWVFMGAWSTGGFAPQSQNIAYYHSFLIEAVTIPIMIAGSFNFGLHFAIWTGKRDEIYRNLETRVFFVVLTVFATIGMLSIVGSGVYADELSLVRRVVYQFISAQTTTGFSNIFAQQFASHWPLVAVLAMILAMLFGGSASSTAGGFKGVRVGIVSKALRMEVRKLMSPESAVIVEKIHMGQDFPLEDRNVKIAALIILLYIATFAVGSLAGVAYGYPLPVALFESASVTGNVGLSSGLVSPDMPWALKVLYILMMWVGRLEFMSVFVFFGILWRLVNR